MLCAFPQRAVSEITKRVTCQFEGPGLEIRAQCTRTSLRVVLVSSHASVHVNIDTVKVQRAAVANEQIMFRGINTQFSLITSGAHVGAL